MALLVSDKSEEVRLGIARKYETSDLRDFFRSHADTPEVIWLQTLHEHAETVLSNDKSEEVRTIAEKEIRVIENKRFPKYTDKQLADAVVSEFQKSKEEGMTRYACALSDVADYLDVSLPQLMDAVEGTYAPMDSEEKFFAAMEQAQPEFTKEELETGEHEKDLVNTNDVPDIGDDDDEPEIED